MKLGPKQKKWIKALKSGKYKQCKEALCNNIGYCCLGVANEILNLGEEDENLLYSYEALGLRNEYGSLKDSYKFPRGRKLYDDLVSMNDRGVPFVKIAEFIENNPELVFTESV